MKKKDKTVILSAVRVVGNDKIDVRFRVAEIFFFGTYRIDEDGGVRVVRTVNQFFAENFFVDSDAETHIGVAIGDD